ATPSRSSATCRMPSAMAQTARRTGWGAGVDRRAGGPPALTRAWRARRMARRLPRPGMARVISQIAQPGPRRVVPIDDVAQREQAWIAQRATAAHCRECPLGALATQTVWGEGPIGAPLM